MQTRHAWAGVEGVLNMMSSNQASDELKVGIQTGDAFRYRYCTPIPCQMPSWGPAPHESSDHLVSRLTAPLAETNDIGIPLFCSAALGRRGSKTRPPGRILPATSTPNPVPTRIAQLIPIEQRNSATSTVASPFASLEWYTPKPQAPCHDSFAPATSTAFTAGAGQAPPSTPPRAASTVPIARPPTFWTRQVLSW